MQLPYIAATPSGEHFARRIATELAHRYLPARMERSGISKGFSVEEIWVPTCFQRFANRDGKVHIDRSIRDANIYVVADLESHATPNPDFAEGESPPYEIRIDAERTRVLHGEEDLPHTRRKIDYERNFNDLLRLLATARSIAGPRAFITAVTPVHASSRQDRRQGRYSLDLKERCVHTESAGANHVLCIDIHNEATELAYNLTTGFDHLYAAYTMLRHLRSRDAFNVGQLHFLAPDAGAFERNLTYAQELGCTIGHLYKRRDPKTANRIDGKHLAYSGKPQEMEGKDVVIVDDMIDTGGTTERAGEFAMENGARSVIAIATHAIFSNRAIDRIDRAVRERKLHKVITTNSVHHPEEVVARHDWWTQLDISPYFAKAIDRHNFGESLSELLRETG